MVQLLQFCFIISSDHVDTTDNQTLAAYDRIIFYGDQLIGSVVEDSAKAFRYDDHPDFGEIDQGRQKLSLIMLSIGYCDQIILMYLLPL
jgi:hypothetical protein